MQYEIGITIYGYVVVEAPSQDKADEMYSAMSVDHILQDMKVNSIDSEHVREIKSRDMLPCRRL
jgi:hypothetical protein